MPIGFAIFVFTSIFIARRKVISALSGEGIISEFTDVFVPTYKGVCALPVLFSIFVFTNVFVARCVGVGSYAVLFSIFVFTNVSITFVLIICERVGSALSIGLTISELTNVFATRCMVIGALPMEGIISEFADIFVAFPLLIGVKGVVAKTVM